MDHGAAGTARLPDVTTFARGGDTVQIAGTVDS